MNNLYDPFFFNIRVKNKIKINIKNSMCTYMLVMCIYKCEFNIIVENIFGLKECFSKHYSYQIHIEVKLKRVISNENRTMG